MIRSITLEPDDAVGEWDDGDGGDEVGDDDAAFDHSAFEGRLKVIFICC